jgi:hypothetical protein
MNKEQIKESLEVAKNIHAEFKPAFEVVNGSTDSLSAQLGYLLHKKLDEEVSRIFGFYSSEQLVEAIRLLNEKPEEKAKLTGIPGGLTEPRPEEVQSEPALEPSPKPPTDKRSKKSVLRRV